MERIIRQKGISMTGRGQRSTRNGGDEAPLHPKGWDIRQTCFPIVYNIFISFLFYGEWSCGI
ncbi:MAG: hypothetical protein LBH90_09315 [Tannerella sp.]|nr:hypothetical protein [Tannerella sp.]